jgi:hypothetical protein
VAVNVILPVPHIAVCDAAIETVGVTLGFTVIVIALLVAAVVVGQGAFDVITQVITSPFTKEAELYVVLLEPTLPPFFFH